MAVQPSTDNNSGLTLWAIATYELKKFIPLCILSFLFTFIYSLLRNIKDALLITAPGGVEAVPFLTIFAIVPVLVFALIYTKLSSLLSKKKLFVLSLLPFLIFFPLFGFVLYPKAIHLHLSAANPLLDGLPAIFSGLKIAIQNWVFSLFYLIEEIWASFAIGVLFWGFANHVTKIREAARFYALFALSANLGTLLSGPVIKYILYQAPLTPNSPFSASILSLMQLCFASAILVLVIFLWINKNVMTDSRFFNPQEQTKLITERPKLNLGESLKFLMHSRYILCVALLVVSYQMVINISEIILKNQLGTVFTEPRSYLTFMSNYSIILGCVSTFSMLFISHNILRLKGWTFTAYITPISILLCGTLFFLSIIFQDALAPLTQSLGQSPLVFSIFAGTALNIIGKTSKYSLFDPTKEMAYIPLDEESKVKGKAIVDSLGSRSGKAFGSVVLITLMSVFGSITQAIPSLALIMLLVIYLWMRAIRELGQNMKSNSS